jgi:sterol desaturase/sphingolipid hydroxylase (fatty acid hydroxylase superfamily)
MIGSWEPWLRIAAFVAVFVAMALWEVARPRRVQHLGRIDRWPSNLGIVVLDTLIVRLLMPTSAVGLALYCETHAWGLFNNFGSNTASAILGFLALDLAIYGLHVLFHYVPVLWRLHRMHHADQEFDVTTCYRYLSSSLS